MAVGIFLDSQLSNSRVFFPKSQMSVKFFLKNFNKKGNLPATK